MKPFSFLISCKKHVESKLSLYADLEPRNHSDASLEILKIDKMDWLIADSFELLWKHQIYLNHAMKKVELEVM